MSEQMIPMRRAVDVLKAEAEARGLRVGRFGRGIAMMCVQCYPHQPERLEYSARKVQPVSLTGDGPWLAVLHDECEGLVRVFYRHGDPGRTFLSLSDAVDGLVVQTCCHDEDNALGGWYLRSDFRRALEHTVESAGHEWADEWGALVGEREAEIARQHAHAAAYEAGRLLTAQQRVQAVAAVLKAAGKGVTVEQARVSWLCGHVTDEWEGQKAGDLQRRVFVIPSDGIPVRASTSCGLPHDDDAPDIAAVAAEYRRVAEMTEEERAAYKPVPEVKRSGWPPRRGRSGGAGPKAQPKPQATPEWFTSRGIDPTQPVQKLFALAKQADPKNHPPRASIEAMKRSAGTE